MGHKFIGKTVDVVWYQALDYRSREVEVLYEKIKNHIEAKATDVGIEIDFDREEIIIYGNGKGLNLETLDYIANNYGRSSKGTLNFGVGLFTFLAVGTDLTIMGKENDKYCIETINSDCESEFNEPTEMDSSMKRERVRYLNKIKKYDHGSVWVIHGVGKSQNRRKKTDCRFNMREIFEEKSTYGKLARKLSRDLNRGNFTLKYGAKKAKKIVKPRKAGEKVRFVVPSKELDMVESDYTYVDRDNKAHIVSIAYDLVLAKGDLFISQKGLDPLNIRDQPRFKADTVFKNPNICGDIEISVLNADGTDDTENLYTPSRDKLLWKSELGYYVQNVMCKAGSHLNPMISKLGENKDEKHDKIVSKKITNELHDFLKRNMKFFGAHNESDVIRSSKTSCKRCSSEDIDASGSENICRNCGNSWRKRDYGYSAERPVRSPNDKTNKERERKRGILGYIVEQVPDIDPYSMSSRDGMTININTINDAWKRSSNVNQKRLIVELILTEIVIHQYGHLPTHAFADKMKRAFSYAARDNFWSTDNSVKMKAGKTDDAIPESVPVAGPVAKPVARPAPTASRPSSGKTIKDLAAHYQSA